jgi:Rieske Fe-S protein
VGGCVVKTIRGRKVVLSQPRSGSVVAFDPACTHKGCPVAAAGRHLTCDCHGSAFNSATGAVEKGPATQPLARLRATVHDGGVSIG